MKKLLVLTNPTVIATLSLLIVSAFLRYYLYVNSVQMINEFKNQNYREIYALDTLKMSSRLNSLSAAINWVCIEGTISNKSFYKIQKGRCETGLIRQKHELYIPQANNLKIIFTTRLPVAVEYLFSIFILFQSLLIFALIASTKKREDDKHLSEIKINKLSRQMSHDIRSPLATLNTLVDNLASIDNESKDLLQRSLLRINEISNRHLLYSQNSLLSKKIPKLESTDINELIQNVVELKRIEFDKNNLNIKISTLDQNYYSKIDAIELRRIISNIINNSVEAMTTTINISISLIDSNQIQILIKDNGNGIPKKILSELGLREVTTKVSGNGLGIIHARESIESWNGSLAINSEINNFTEISLILPLINNEKKLETKVLTVLIDDDELVRLTWEFKAKKHGINFIAYKSYYDFMESIDNISFDSFIYIDSELGEDIKGEEISMELNKLGYHNLYIASGNEAEQFKNYTFLKGIRNKTPPW